MRRVAITIAFVLCMTTCPAALPQQPAARSPGATLAAQQMEMYLRWLGPDAQAYLDALVEQRVKAELEKRANEARQRGDHVRPFRGSLEVYLDRTSGQPNPLTDVSLAGTVKVGDRTFFQFKRRWQNGRILDSNAAESWLIDPARIVAVKSTPCRQTGVGAPPGQFGNVPP